MMSNWLALGLDVITVVLLATVITYAVILNKRLKTIRDSRKQLEQLSQQFIEATDRAEASIQHLKSLADNAGRDLEERVHKAQTLNDELAFLVQRADDLAEKLTEGISQNRPKAKVQDDLNQALKDLEKKADQWEREGGKPGKKTENKKEDDVKRNLKGLR